MRKPPKVAQTPKGKADKGGHHNTDTLESKILGSIDIKQRTDDFYKRFALDMIKNDVEKDLRK